MWIELMKKNLELLPSDCERRLDLDRSIVAVVFRLFYFGYHRDEYARILSEALTSVEPKEHARIFLDSRFDPTLQEVRGASFHAGAHSIAAIQFLHSACDIYARIAFWSLGLQNSTKLQLERLNIFEVAKQSSRDSGRLLQSLADSSEFRYLNALVNVNKHRQIIRALPRWEQLPNGDEEGGLGFSSFEYGRSGKTKCEYPARPVTEVLTVEAEKIVQKLNLCGDALSVEFS